MGWEQRHGGKWYLYRNRRINGKPVKEYLAARDGLCGFWRVMVLELDRLQAQQAELRAIVRQNRVEYQARIDDLITAASAANTRLRTVAEGILYAVGYHKHQRGEWRMKRERQFLAQMIEALKGNARPAPLVTYTAPADDAEAVELFDKARTGDAGAAAGVQALIRDRKWMDWIGDIGKEATHQLIARAAGDDAVWKAGITEKVRALSESLLGENPSVLEELLVRRVVNGWVTTHALELELAARPPVDPRSRQYLDQAMTRAQKRYAEAIRELARVRRLQAPRLLAKFNCTVSDNAVSGETPPKTPKRRTRR
jgi:hypothetical protein